MEISASVGQASGPRPAPPGAGGPDPVGREARDQTKASAPAERAAGTGVQEAVRSVPPSSGARGAEASSFFTARAGPGAERGAEIDAARLRGQEAADKAALADRRADEVTGDKAAATAVSEVNRAEADREAKADAGDPEARVERAEAERSEAILRSERPGADAEVTEAADRSGAAVETDDAGPRSGPGSRPDARAGDGQDAAPDPGPPVAADDAGRVRALARAAEAAYAEAVAGQAAQARGEATERIV